MSGIEDKRKKIDELDKKVLELLNSRTELIKDIAALKRKDGKAVFDPVREKQIVDKIVAENKGRFPEKSLKLIFREMISACRSLEDNLKIGFLGPETTFTHLAAIKQFGSEANFVELDSIQDVFAEVEKGHVNYGVVPIENSTEGTVTHTLDMFLDAGLKISAEIRMNVKHSLLSKYKKEEIQKIYSHPQALAQCRKYLAKNFPKAEIIEVASTAKAAEAASLYHSSAAIASNLAARKYGLETLDSGIEDSSSNKTRFLVIGKELNRSSGKDKTSIVYSVPHKSGSLHDSLGVLKKHGLNMTKIESRPSKNTNWEYVFFVDFEGHTEDEKVKKALEELQEHTQFLKILGSYPLVE
ncbi:MAG: prephenate dehydratase [Candidatus Diapherotrites archaeon]|nr:prephenate dehydratase [Candidatus Diapherotrites archaeon]